MNRVGHSLFLLFLLGIFAGGCSAVHPTTVDYSPSGKGPLSSIKPLTISIKVVDQRPPSEQDSVLQLKALVGATDTWSTKKPVPLIVQDALISELSRCGHHPVTDPIIAEDASIRIVLKRFIATFSAKVSGASEAEVDAEVIVTNRVKKETTPPFQISGNYQQEVEPNRKGPDKALSEALAEFIHNLTFDSRLVEALQ